MNGPERVERDKRIMELFVSGAGYRQIADAVELRSVSRVHEIVQRELADAARRRGLVTDEAFALWQERHERLFRAHWSKALEGNHRSTEFCLKMLDQQSKIYGLQSETRLPSQNSPSQSQDGDVDGDQAPEDELARLRAARAGT